MKSLLKFIGLLLFLFLLFSLPATAAYYDHNGVAVDKDQYEKIVKMRQANTDQINTVGYGEGKSTLEDPVLLRKKRIEQWKALQKPENSVRPKVKNPKGSGKK